MKYQFHSRVRGSESDKERRLTIGGLINYFQDTSTFNTDKVKKNTDWLMERELGWILASWQICIKRMPKTGEKILVSTWLHDFRSFFAYRNFTLEGEGGELLAWANSVWIFWSLKEGKPLRVDKSLIDEYEMEESFPMDYASRKLKIAKGGSKREAILVSPHLIDINQHVNNSWYVRLAADYLPEGYPLKEIRVEYKRQAREGDLMIPWILEKGEHFQVKMCDDKEEAYAVVDFLK